MRTSHKPQDPDLPTKEEVRLLSNLPDDVQARLSLAGTKAEAEFHADAIYYHLPDHEDDYDPGEVEDKKRKLMGICDRLASRVVRSYFEELAALPIAPGTLRRLLYYILANVSTRLFRDKWRAYVPAPSESQAEFLGTALEYHRPAIEQYYGDALRAHEKRLAESLKSGTKKPIPAKVDQKKKTNRRGRQPDDDVSARNAFIAVLFKQGLRGLKIAKRLDHAGKYDDDGWLEKKRANGPKLTWEQAARRYPTHFSKLVDRATTP